MNAINATAVDTSAIAPGDTIADFSKARLVWWSLRRELWENRSIVLGPLIVAALMLLALGLGVSRFGEAMRGLSFVDPAQRADLIARPLALTAIPILLTGILVSVFYCLGALHGERSDRSILFWKSLPVSDLVTVMAKALVPLLVVPAVTVLAIVGLQFLILLGASAFLLANGLDGTALWTGLPLVTQWGTRIHGVFALALWHAPIYVWLLLVSGWAKRSTFLYAVLVPLALCMVERIAVGTNVLWWLLKDRLIGFDGHGFVLELEGMSRADPLGLLVSPGFWIGLVVAALLIAATIWMRRYRQPI